MAFPLKLSRPHLFTTSGKFCLPLPRTLTGVFSATAVTKSITSITRSSTTATVTATAHGLKTGDIVNISGAAQIQYNGLKKVVVTGVNTFTFYVDGTATTPATGTIIFTTGGEAAIGVGTLAGDEFFVGDWIYVPAENAMREVVSIDSLTSWRFGTPFPSTVSSQPIIVAKGNVYKGVSVLNNGGADGVYLEDTVATGGAAVTVWDEAGLTPVCGDATGTTFQVLTQ